ncbi:hypothetical protein LTR08_003895 [Meristemomyces frigidus]|nr:hypothetical protein LTR08_003895 [Meristemomyces frigidus]
MATAANPPLAAIPANGSGDTFASSPAGPHRYASFDTDQFSSYSSHSPSQARRALEAHMTDTDRRIQDASRLGTTLLQQRKELSARLKDVEQVQHEDEVPDELRKKLAELEREYNEIGKESARAFLPKPKAVLDVGAGPAVLTGQARDSPTKVAAPSRRQRNQPSNRVHDIEFATEISTSLLAQVRQLQAALAEKDDEFKDTLSAKAHLEAEAANMAQRMKQMDEHEQRYKDENWNLETKLQDLETGHREISDKHDRLGQTLKSTHLEKAAAQRELDDLKVSHEKLSEQHSIVKKQQEADLHGLRKDVASQQTDRDAMQRKIEELTSQNTELARAVSYRWNQAGQATDMMAISPAGDQDDEDVSPEHSEPASPIKGTPRHGMLESETLKSSLNHAHRMIQNLKNNIHREKTEKIELKRMLQDARDELETRRVDGGVGANMAKKRKSEAESAKYKKSARPERLGANRSSTTEIIEDEPDWEDHDGELTPSKSRFAPIAGAAFAGAGAAATSSTFDHAAFDGRTDAESTDAFETANERDLATENEAFETGHEDLGVRSSGDDDDDDGLTETEDTGLRRSGTVRGDARPSPLGSAEREYHRRSYQSTASTSGEEGEEVVRTPVQSALPKYRIRVSRGARRSGGRLASLVAGSPGQGSPGSGQGTPGGGGAGLGGGLWGVGFEAVGDGSVEGTPGRMGEGVGEMERGGELEGELEGEEELDGGEEGLGGYEPEFSSPVVGERSLRAEGEEVGLAHHGDAAMLAHERVTRKVEYVDSGMMTEPWQPEKEAVGGKHSVLERAGEVVGGALGGALAGFGLGRVGRGKEEAREVEEKDVKGGAEDAHSSAGRLEEPSAETTDEDSAPVPYALKQNEGAPTVQRGIEEQQSQAVRDDESVAAPLAPEAITEDANIVRDTATEPSAAATAPIAPRQAPAAPLRQSDILYQETEPVSPPRRVQAGKRPEPVRSSSGLQRITDAASKPEVPLVAAAAAAAAPLVVHHYSERQVPEQNLGFSGVDAQEFAPQQQASRPIVAKRDSRRTEALDHDEDRPGLLYKECGPLAGTQDLASTLVIPGTEAARPGAAFFAAGAPPPLARSRSKSMPGKAEGSLRSVESKRSIIEPRVFGGVRKGTSGIPTLVFGESDDSGPETMMGASLRDIPQFPAPGGRAVSDDSIPKTRPLSIRKYVADEGSRTIVSGDEIDDMMRDKSRTSSMATSTTDAGVSPGKPSTPTRRSVESATFDPAALSRGPRRPLSAGSMRSKSGVAVPPPLPEDYTWKITAAVQKAPGPSALATAGTMGPPMMPASAYKLKRPKTPVDRPHERALSRDGTTPRAVRPRDSRVAVASPSGTAVSRRTSVSSFASELDERFNITRAGGGVLYPSDVAPATDPRMIQAITQTMIGEFLWKYTRKAGRSETSTTRHRRFFWVHPYTRTLYWSEQDPSTAGRSMLKAKSVAIQSVRVVTDDNAYPPGLHRKSIVVVTPGREIVFTAPTGQRHETWFNALSYLLLRTEQEKGEAEDTFDQEDIEEFNPNPGFSIRRSISRMTGAGGRSQSRQSHSSYNGRARTSSPRKRTEAGAGAALLQASAAQRSRSQAATPTLTPDLAPPAARTISRTSTTRDSASVSGRFSSLTSKFRASGGSRSQRGSFSSRGRPSLSLRGRHTTGDPASEIYDASVVVGGESAEDLRAVIERQERDAGRLENVRACCDGKHDVGSLSKTGGRQSSMGARFGAHSLSHAHGHPPPRAEPIKGSLRPRRGE